jgi:hypothetical protein
MRREVIMRNLRRILRPPASGFAAPSFRALRGISHPEALSPRLLSFRALRGISHSEALPASWGFFVASLSVTTWRRRFFSMGFALPRPFGRRRAQRLATLCVRFPRRLRRNPTACSYRGTRAESPACAGATVDEKMSIFSIGTNYVSRSGVSAATRWRRLSSVLGLVFRQRKSA